MKRLLWSALAAFFVVALLSCGGGGGGQQLIQLTPAMSGTTLTSSISSAQTGIAYDLDIWLPPGYAGGTATYPVVYATDCEYRWATLLQDVQQFAAQGGTQVILVNICAGSPARRFVDFTMPGASAYFRFLTLELIPSIDATYRTNPGNRTLSGHSLSGEFVIWALYLEDPTHRYFTSMVSEEGSFWDDSSGNFSTFDTQATATDNAMLLATQGRLPINLILAGDTMGNGTLVSNLHDLFVSRHYQDLRLDYLVYSLGHVPMDGPAFAAALSFIFPGT